MELYYSFSVLIVLVALSAYINHKFIKLPPAIGIMLFGLAISLVFRIVGYSFFPNTSKDVFEFLLEFNFTDVLLGAMLNFLLFAGAIIHVRASDLKEEGWHIFSLASLSVIISAFVMGGIVYYLIPLLSSYELPFLYCLLFGALISPTDPIAVLGILKKANISKSMESKIVGESLFNDGIAVVLFAVILQLIQSNIPDVSLLTISWLFVKEAIGGLLLGFLLGFTATRAIKSVNDHTIATFITLSVVMGGYLVAARLHISAPLAMVTAGLVIGGYGKRKAMSHDTEDYLYKFWHLIDETLNTILFLLVGLQFLLIPNLGTYLLGSFSCCHCGSTLVPPVIYLDTCFDFPQTQTDSRNTWCIGVGRVARRNFCSPGVVCNRP